MDLELMRKALQSYRDLLQEMLAVSLKQMETAGSTALEDEKLEEFNLLIQERQALMQKIEALPVRFSEMRERPELQAEVEQIQDIVKTIRENDEITVGLLKEKAAALWVKLTEVQTGKKAVKAYNKEDYTVAPWFLDTRK